MDYLHTFQELQKAVTPDTFLIFWPYFFHPERENYHSIFHSLNAFFDGKLSVSPKDESASLLATTTYFQSSLFFLAPPKDSTAEQWQELISQTIEITAGKRGERHHLVCLQANVTPRSVHSSIKSSSYL